MDLLRLTDWGGQDMLEWFRPSRNSTSERLKRRKSLQRPKTRCFGPYWDRYKADGDQKLEADWKKDSCEGGQGP